MARAGRFLVAVWAAGGNVMPAAGLARLLAGRGHDVRVLGPPVLAKRFEQAGCTFHPYRRARAPHLVEEEVLDDNLLGWTRFIAGTRLADDVLAEVEASPADVVIADAFLSSALSAAEKTDLPAVALVHVLYQPCVEGRNVTSWDPTRPIVDATRRHLGLPMLDPSAPLVATLWARARLVLACMPESFDFPLTSRPRNLHYVGPIFDDVPGPRRPPKRPRVLVSFSTTDMRQDGVLQRVLDGLETLDVDVVCTLGGVPIEGLRQTRNAQIRDWVPHAEVLPSTSVVVTHAGLSTVLSAMASGVPLVCLPLGREQPLNAERVAALGLGRNLPCEASADVIAAAVQDVISDGRFAERAHEMAEVTAGYGQGALAVSEVEALL
ncbi:MAG: glycosyltransferase family 1 protein [Acidimicrobiales bacterium]|nr:glycosyltransferase family 1 protein [Acidimicrobiales bacterium]